MALPSSATVPVAASPSLAAFDAADWVPADGDVGFYGTTPVAQQTGVAETAEGIHAALVNVGIITA